MLTGENLDFVMLANALKRSGEEVVLVMPAPTMSDREREFARRAGHEPTARIVVAKGVCAAELLHYRGARRATPEEIAAYRGERS